MRCITIITSTIRIHADSECKWNGCRKPKSSCRTSNSNWASLGEAGEHLLCAMSSPVAVLLPTFGASGRRNVAWVASVEFLLPTLGFFEKCRLTHFSLQPSSSYNDYSNLPFILDNVDVFHNQIIPLLN